MPGAVRGRRARQVHGGGGERAAGAGAGEHTGAEAELPVAVRWGDDGEGDQPAHRERVDGPRKEAGGPDRASGDVAGRQAERLEPGRPGMDAIANAVANVEDLEERLSEPTEAVLRAVEKLEGDYVILGVGGKMGPTLARMVRRALDHAAKK